MKILIIGEGAREHALMWKLMTDAPSVDIYCAPGNDAMSLLAHNAPFDLGMPDNLAHWALENRIDLVVIGSREALSSGVGEHLRRLGIEVLGATEKARQLEEDLSLAREVMSREGLPVIASQAFASPREAMTYLQEVRGFPLIIKAGEPRYEEKGAVALNRSQALRIVSEVSNGRVVLEEYLSGKEIVIMAFADGHDVVPLPVVRSYRHLHDEDQGPETSGMGGCSSPTLLSPELKKRILETVLRSATSILAEGQRPYRGLLTARVRITLDEEIRFLQLTTRVSDPETQIALPRLRTRLMDLLTATVAGRLNEVGVEESDEVTCGAVLVSQGYPRWFTVGGPISGLEELDEGTLVFHGATTLPRRQGLLPTAGVGRILTVVVRGEDMIEARGRLYENLERIHFQGCHYRRDIGRADLADIIIG